MPCENEGANITGWFIGIHLVRGALINYLINYIIRQASQSRRLANFLTHANLIMRGAQSIPLPFVLLNYPTL